MISIAIANLQNILKPDTRRCRQAIRSVFADAGHAAADISLAFVDDARIHDLNRQFLDHDYPTDVLSFPLSDCLGRVDGEIVVSAETACRVAAELRRPPQEELLLYVIHGALHLVGFDDKTASAARAMRERERHYLARFGGEPLAGHSAAIRRNHPKKPRIHSAKVKSSCR